MGDLGETLNRLAEVLTKLVASYLRLIKDLMSDENKESRADFLFTVGYSHGGAITH